MILLLSIWNGTNSCVTERGSPSNLNATKGCIQTKKGWKTLPQLIVHVVIYK